MTPADIQRQIRESLGLPPVPEPQTTIPIEGHVCEFPLWSFSKKRSTVKELQAKQIACGTVNREPWGIATTIRLPSGGEIGLYQPLHQTAFAR